MNAVEWLSPGGLISERLENYETRPQQIEMAEAVGRAFAERQHLIVEAGTGVGKSFAYLLPAIERAVDHHERVVISTRTIALQEQLMNKDIPFLQSVLPVEVRVALVKGRNNYLGLRRLAVASRKQQRQQLFDAQGQQSELWRIEDWALQTSDGSLADLSPLPSPAVWERVRSEHDNCMGRRCPSYEACFFQRARRRAERAGMLIVNHSLFFSDLALRGQGNGLLPDYDLVVLDEAHTVDRVAAEHLGLDVSESSVRFLLNTLHHERSGRGVLTGCEAESAIRLVGDVRRTAETFFGALAAWQSREGRPNGRLSKPPPVENRLSPGLRGLAVTLRGVRSARKDEDERFELTSRIDRTETLAAQIDTLLTQEHDAWVYWLETGPSGRPGVSLHGRPLDVSDALKTTLFDRIGSVVLTSATLAAGGDEPFAYLRRRVGLRTGVEIALGSPFHYATQMSVNVEVDLPDPNDAERFIPAACEAISRHVRTAGGGTLVLFTSYAMLNACAERLGPVFDHDGVRLFVHGAEMSRSAMLDAFRADGRSVILGTDSFWEGVDVPGAALSVVVIVKLPFAAPNRPDTEARIEHLRAAGEDPFKSFQLPEAILKFKQGVGRLIRTRSDRGKVVVLDSRIIRKGYGRSFLNSLPHCPVTVHPRKNLSIEEAR